jgi:hypothetical protein
MQMVGYRKQEEQQRVLHMLENAKIEAEQSALAKAHFLSNMSHGVFLVRVSFTCSPFV